MTIATRTNGTTNPNKQGFWNSIQTQLMIWSLLLSLIPTVIVGVLAYVNAQNALHESIEAELEAMSAERGHAVENWLFNLDRELTMITDLQSIQGSEDTNDEFGSDLGIQVLERYQNSIENRSIYNRAYTEALHTLEGYVERYPHLHGLFLVSTDGEVLVSTDSENHAEGINVGSEDYFTQGLSEFYMSEPTIHPYNNGGIDLHVSHPIYDGNSKLIGVIFADIEDEELTTILQNRTGLGETGETYLVDGNTFLMLSEPLVGDEDAVLKKRVDTFGVQEAISTQSDGVANYLDYHGAPVMGAWHYIPERNWVLMAEMDQVEAYASVRQMAWMTVLIVGILAGIVLVLSYLISRTIARPIAVVANTASQLAAGELEHRVDYSSKNEIGVLADAFNTMAENLQEMVESERESKNYLETVVNDYSDFIEDVAQGNLTRNLELNGDSNEDYENLHILGNNLNSMVNNLREMALQIQDTAMNVASASTEILAATTQQIASTTEQEAAVTQTMTTVEEVRATVKQTAERAQGVANASKQSVEISFEGQQSVANSIEGMQLIRQRVEGIAENILMLSERTQQIGEIIETVNEIAAQSKLLALNASIEAARAGEEGKGFAVVAMEVRQLAEQSRDATERVRDILNQIQQATNTAVMVTEEGSKGAESGMQLVEQAGASINALANTIEEAAQAATQIAASTGQQNNGMEQLAQAMASIKQASIQAAASTQQAERSAQELNELARQMQDAVARYRLN